MSERIEVIKHQLQQLGCKVLDEIDKFTLVRKDGWHFPLKFVQPQDAYEEALGIANGLKSEIEPPKPDPFEAAWDNYNPPANPYVAKDTFTAGWDAAIKWKEGQK